jgi:hypothetical protein
MKRLTRLTVIAPGFRRSVGALDGAARLPVLERLAARGRYQHENASEPSFQPLEPWQREAARVLGMQPLPSAPLSALGAGLAPPNGTWLHAQFVHLAAGLDHLILVPLRAAQALDETSLVQLRAALAQHVSEEGYEWLSTGAMDFLRMDASMQVETCAPDIASRMSMVEAMPRGRDAARLRRLMTELQMQLHDHPLNRQRERSGLLPANSVWLWGAGALPAASGSRRGWGHVFADDAYVRGLAQLADVQCEPLPQNGDVVLRQAAANTLVLLHWASLATLESDWLAPSERALHRGHLEQLELILDDIHIIADRWSRWRVWRRARPLTLVIA